MVAGMFSEEDVRRAADPMSFARGQDYRAGGRVRKLAVEESTATAVVDGGRPYRVELARSGSGLVGDCDCPYGAAGAFCKHCVAAALAWLDLGGVEAKPEVPDPAVSADADLRAFLREQDPQWLVDELLRAACLNCRGFSVRPAAEVGPANSGGSPAPVAVRPPGFAPERSPNHSARPAPVRKPTSWRSCPTCGQPGRIHAGRCAQCTINRRLRKLLAAENGLIPKHLQAFYQTVTATSRPSTVESWLNRSTTPAILRELRTRGELTHETLDALPPGKPVEHLRSVLVAAGALL